MSKTAIDTMQQQDNINGINGARGGDRTRTPLPGQRILSPIQALDQCTEGPDSLWIGEDEVAPDAPCPTRFGDIHGYSDAWPLLGDGALDATVWVDRADAAKLSHHAWTQTRTKSGHRYAKTTINGVSVYLHRYILDAKPGEIIDHINGNGLDCRRSNLRICNSKQNSQNRAAKRGKLGLKGVTARPRGKFQAQILVNGKSRSLGYYSSAEDAATAYDDAARAHFGEFARLNFPHRHSAEVA